MSKPELRYPCPVCLGVQLEKLALGAEPKLVLDYCQRCGGIWFDEGEVRRLRGLNPKALWAKVALRDAAYRMKCHNCHASMGRNDSRCGACGWTNTLDCPVCAKYLETVEHGGLRLDVCRRCRGAWFDSVELSRIWNRSVDALAARRNRGRSPDRVEADWFFLPDVIWWPGPLTGPVPAPPIGLSGAPVLDTPDVGDGGFFSSLGNALGSAAEWTGDLASSVFGGIADVFDGIDFDF